jgi:hypothetical protein
MKLLITNALLFLGIFVSEIYFLIFALFYAS